MRLTQRTGTDNNFTEHVEGDAPSSVEVSVNAKGQAQFSLKLYYLTPAEIDHEIEEDLTAIVTRIRGTLALLGIPLAGDK